MVLLLLLREVIYVWQSMYFEIDLDTLCFILLYYSWQYAKQCTLTTIPSHTLSADTWTSEAGIR